MLNIPIVRLNEVANDLTLLKTIKGYDMADAVLVMINDVNIAKEAIIARSKPELDEEGLAFEEAISQLYEIHVLRGDDGAVHMKSDGVPTLKDPEMFDKELAELGVKYPKANAFIEVFETEFQNWMNEGTFSMLGITRNAVPEQINATELACVRKYLSN